MRVSPRQWEQLRLVWRCLDCGATYVREQYGHQHEDERDHVVRMGWLGWSQGK